VIDVAIIGAGVIGASIAYWLTRFEPSSSVVLIERDASFAQASSSLSASSIRQQFSSAVNIRMSLFGVRFLQEMQIRLEEQGYLYLGAAKTLRNLHQVQIQNGANVALLSPVELAARFPWLNAEDLELGSLGLSGEGWYDGPALHAVLLRRARDQGARLIDGEARGFQMQGGKVHAVLLGNGSSIECGHAVNAAGPWARRLAAAAGVALPVHARRRTVLVLSCPQSLPGCPLVVDPSGFWFRPEGRHFIAGTTPEPDSDDLPLEANLAEFDEALWSRMAHRCRRSRRCAWSAPGRAITR
jgi:FAD-dependent oxidoreductase domain-containing protein 1